MDNKNRNISIQDIEEIHRKTEMKGVIEMKKEKSIKVIELDELSHQADILSGLSHVCAMYLSFTKENDFLQNALECLNDEANKHQDYCNLLLEKIST